MKPTNKEISVTKEYLPHQQRVIEEQEDLSRRIFKLECFTATEIFSRLPQVDRNMLIKQLEAMKAYELILRARIARF
ncbi:TPA: hypothetical protein SCS53_004072 [Enterobacter kobei]|nr:hypothetical protein [Enterobacter kobei]HEG1746818.1 hypothetical protein [Enterobacter kobei]HEG1824672.1 hypothetical protein [Enterobacter kobei]HEG2123534.1 hypothetical protein [Enterobacter kobei]HEG2174417.1 hypothetical protein [Enterobacter kobei]